MALLNEFDAAAAISADVSADKAAVIGRIAALEVKLEASENDLHTKINQNVVALHNRVLDLENSTVNAIRAWISARLHSLAAVFHWGG